MCLLYSLASPFKHILSLAVTAYAIILLPLIGSRQANRCTMNTTTTSATKNKNISTNNKCNDLSVSVLYCDKDQLVSSEHWLHPAMVAVGRPSETLQIILHELSLIHI